MSSEPFSAFAYTFMKDIKMKTPKRTKITERQKDSESQSQKLASALKSPEWVRFCFEAECG